MRMYVFLRLSFLASSLCAAAVHAQVGTLADSNGTVRAWGENNYGQTDVVAGSYKAIAAGFDHSLALRTDGSVVGWGWGWDGQTASQAGPFTTIAAGHRHSLALRADGSLFGWGWNGYGQANSLAGPFKAIAGGQDHSLALRADGSILRMARAFPEEPTPTGTFLAIAAGDYHSLALRADGSLAQWKEYGGPSGISVPPTGSFTTISAGGNRSAALRTDGSLVYWGYGSTTSQAGVFTAVSVGRERILGLRADGSVAAFMGGGAPTSQSGAYVSIAAGWRHSLALEAQSVYAGDLRVYGTGLTANLNRSLLVAGNLDVQTTTSLYNTPVATVAGNATFIGGGLSGAGSVSVGGGVSLTGTTTISNGASLSSEGALSGAGTLKLSGGSATFGLGPLSSFTGRFEVANGGTLRFSRSGVIGASALDNAGDVRLNGGQRMIANTVANRGRVDVYSGGLQTLGSFNNEAGGTLSSFGATLRFNGGLTNQGGLAFSFGGNEVYGNVRNSGTLSLSSGASGPAASATFRNGLVNDGTLTVGSRDELTVLGDFSGSGSVTGDGRVILEGGLKPGGSATRLAFGASLELGARSRTEIDLAGAGLNDRVDVTGDLALGGTLGVRLLDGFQLAAGQSFTIFTASGSLTGGFAGLSDGALVGTYGGQNLLIAYGAHDVRLRAEAVPEPASMAALALGAVGLLRRRRR